jgi:hypothetical protein
MHTTYLKAGKAREPGCAQSAAGQVLGSTPSGAGGGVQGRRRAAAAGERLVTLSARSSPMNLAKAFSCCERASGWKDGTAATAAT